MKKREHRKIYLAIFIACILFQNTSAQQPGNSLLWRIEGKGIQTSYLYGTFHLLSKADFELKEKVSDAFHESDQLVMELKMDDPMMQMEMMKHISMKDGMTLDKLLDSIDYRKLDEALKEAVGMGVVMFNTFKPMLISSFLIMNYIEGEPASFELTLTSMAKEKEMVVAGLETVEYQMRIFDEVPYEDQVKDLLEMINEEERLAKQFRTMIKTYQEEDLDALYRLTQEDAASEMELELMLYKRNSEWVSKIDSISAETKAFYAVGAAHLGGEKGLVNLLREAGYELTPVY